MHKKMLFPRLLSYFLLFVHFELVSSLNVLYVSSCQMGHLTPTGALSRALVKRGHKVDVFMGDDCCNSLVPKILPNVSACYHSSIFPVAAISSNNQIESLFMLSEVYGENATLNAFHAINKHLEQHPHYDVIVNDYVMTGANLAAWFHRKPVVGVYPGPWVLPVENCTAERTLLIYYPESNLPKILLNMAEIVGAFAWNTLISDNVYKYINRIQMEYNIKPYFKDLSSSVYAPFSYYYYSSNLIHIGPPDVTLINLEYMEHKNNLHHVGFVPDEYFLAPLSCEVEAFISQADKPIVYLSLGSLVTMDLNKFETMFDEMTENTKYCFIWSAPSHYYKFLLSKQNNNKREQNVLIVSQISQLTLLMKEKVKLFITHGGANSLQEAIYAEVPMLVFPGFGDQPINARALVREKLALPLVDFTFAEISRKLEMIFDGERYLELKQNIAASKKRMVALGGFERAADIVEKVYTGELKVIAPPPLKQVYWPLLFEFLGNLLVIVSVPVAALFVLFKLCRLRHEKHKTD